MYHYTELATSNYTATLLVNSCYEKLYI